MLLAKTLRSSTFKLALVSIGVFGAVVVALFAYVYWSTATFVMDRVDRTVDAERAMLHDAYDRDGRDGLVRATEQRVAQAPPGGAVYLVTDAALSRLAGNLKEWPASLPGAQGRGAFRAAPLRRDAPLQQSLFRFTWETLPGGLHLLVGANIDELSRFTNEIHKALALAITLILVLAAVASVSVTRRTVGRIEAINSTSRAIMESGLGQRVPIRGKQDEWDQLAQNLNAMLGRIESLMDEVRQVSDNVAHDLRTPLTRMRGRLEKASAGPRDSDGDRSVINSAIADLDDVLRMFSSLTRISQIETANRTSAFRAVDLREIAEEVGELFDAAAEDNGGGRVEVTGAKPAPIVGDRDLLFDAIANLVDNAIKHGRPSGVVIVSVDSSAGGVAVSVADDGPGIPAAERPNVVKRFYRLERSRRTPGNGLGLSLVAAVARLHGARMRLSDNAPGLKVELFFSSSRAQGEAMPA